jgi:hypothetical protein
MEVFAWNPLAANEDLPDFNDRVAAFCVDNPVLDISVSTLGPAILLSLTLAEDAEVEASTAIVPRVMLITEPQLKTLEKTVGDELAEIAAQDSDDSPSLPFKVTLHEAVSARYAVILINAGEIDFGEDGAEEEAPAPAPAPAPRGGK